MTDANPASGGLAASGQDADVDMSGVDPLRFAEVRRRISVIKAFMRTVEPTDEDRSRHADSLGLSVNQFLALVRAWREHGRAVAISGAGAAKGAPRPKGARNLPAASKAAAAEIIATLGPDVSLVETVRLIRERCGVLRVAAPSRATIWNMVMAHRRSNGAAGPDGVLVCRCWVKLPMEMDGSIQFPAVALAVQSPTGIILAAALVDEPGAATAIAVGIDQRTSDSPVTIDAQFAEDVSAHTDTAMTPVKPTAARTATAKVLGRGFGTLDLIYQRSRAVRPADLLRSRKDAALRSCDVRRVIADQIAAHNATRGVQRPTISWPV